MFFTFKADLSYALDHILHSSLVKRGMQQSLHLLDTAMSCCQQISLKTLKFGIENGVCALSTCVAEFLDDCWGFKWKCFMASTTRAPELPLQTRNKPR
jgi:hypothetical protein